MFRSFLAATLVLGACMLSERSLASGVGTLNNFDVVNDTPSPCHGFEIELEDMHPGDVPYTFGGDYIRYGTPEVLDTTDDPAHPRVLVRYRRWNGSAWEATPVAPPNVTPQGHDCYANGPIGNYLDSGCEHFGVSLSASPSRTSYRWLVATDPNDQNSPFTVVPQPVDIPVPVFSVAPAGGGGGGVDLRAELEPLEEENHAQWGEPQWLRVYKIKSEIDLQPEDLVKLLLGVDGGILPDETEIESEWKLIQSRPGDAEGEQEEADIKEDRLDSRQRSVIRRYEFFHYTGPRDAENNEALPCINDDQPVPIDAPVEGCSDLGDFVGAQNVAVDVGLSLARGPLPAGEVGLLYGDVPLVGGGLPPYVVAVIDGALPPGLMLDPATGVLNGIPTEAGDFSFEVEVEDATSERVRGPFELSVVPSLLCVGSCNGDADVSIDELITLVSIALGIQAPSTCADGVPAGATVDIALIVGAVGHALNGCAS